MSTSDAITTGAAVVDRYGPRGWCTMPRVARPQAGPGEVLVRVRAAAVTAADSRIRRACFPPVFGPAARLVFGTTRPRRPILGGTFTGDIETIGAGVADFEPGQAVCGMTGTKLGTYAEYVAVTGRRVAHVPAGVSLEDAAGVLFGGTAALFFLRDRASVAPGRSVLVNGASGAGQRQPTECTGPRRSDGGAARLAVAFGALPLWPTCSLRGDIARRCGVGRRRPDHRAGRQTNWEEESEGP